MPQKPKPFTRPSVDLGKPAERVWQTIRVSDLSPGDIVPEKGEVVSHAPTLARGVQAVQFFSGHIEYYDHFAEVWCFSLRDRSGDSS